VVSIPRPSFNIEPLIFYFSNLKGTCSISYKNHFQRLKSTGTCFTNSGQILSRNLQTASCGFTIFACSFHFSCYADPDFAFQFDKDLFRLLICMLFRILLFLNLINRYRCYRLYLAFISMYRSLAGRCCFPLSQLLKLFRFLLESDGLQAEG
jgi:hypothetical protein